MRRDEHNLWKADCWLILIVPTHWKKRLNKIFQNKGPPGSELWCMTMTLLFFIMPCRAATTNALVKNEKSRHSDELKTCYIATSGSSSILHPTAPPSLLSRPSAYVRVTAVAFTYGKAHSKPAWDHLHLTCPSCRPGGVTSHGVTSYPCSLFMLSWYYPPPQLHCSLLPVLSMQMGTFKGPSWQTHSSV